MGIHQPDEEPVDPRAGSPLRLVRGYHPVVLLRERGRGQSWATLVVARAVIGPAGRAAKAPWEYRCVPDVGSRYRVGVRARDVPSVVIRRRLAEPHDDRPVIRIVLSECAVLLRIPWIRPRPWRRGLHGSHEVDLLLVKAGRRSRS